MNQELNNSNGSQFVNGAWSTSSPSPKDLHYVQIAMGMATNRTSLQVVGIDMDGNACVIGYFNGTTWYLNTPEPLRFPMRDSQGETVKMRQITTAPGNDNFLQVLTVGNDAASLFYIACYMDAEGTWKSGAATEQMSGTRSPILCGPGYHHGFPSLHVMRLFNGAPNVAAYQNQNGSWYTGKYENVPTAEGSYGYFGLGVGTKNVLQVLALNEKGQVVLTNSQSSGDGATYGSWTAGSAPLPQHADSYKKLFAGPGDGQYLPIFCLNGVGDAFLATYQASDGQWHQGEPLVPSTHRLYQQLVSARAADGTIQLVGLGKDAKPHVVAAGAKHASSNHYSWTPGTDALRTPYNFKELVIAQDFNGHIQLGGLAEDGMFYPIAAYSSDGRTWSWK